MDCRGQVRPDLAISWASDTSRQSWTFTLRDLPGLPAESAASRLVSGWGEASSLGASGVRSASPLDGGQLVVTMETPHDSVPRVLADPGLGLRGPENSAPSAGPVFYSRSEPVLRFMLAPGSDLRDALDRGADLAVTGDPAVVEYAASRAGFDTFPLPWSRTYVLLQPPGAVPLPGSIGSDSVRLSLAQDAVRAEARAAEPPFWWDSIPVCPARLEAQVSRIASRVVYPARDPVARGLAARLVALEPPGTGLTAAGLSRPELAAALRTGAERAFILPVPRRTLTPCSDSEGWPAGASLLPLVDTRARAILRRGSANLTVDWDGTVRILAP